MLVSLARDSRVIVHLLNGRVLSREWKIIFAHLSTKYCISQLFCFGEKLPRTWPGDWLGGMSQSTRHSLGPLNLNCIQQFAANRQWFWLKNTAKSCRITLRSHGDSFSKLNGTNSIPKILNGKKKLNRLKQVARQKFRNYMKMISTCA